MLARPRHLALGLRGRIVGAVLLTTVATLGVAAIALLGRLEPQVRNAELNTLKSQMRGQAQAFAAIPDLGTAALYKGPPPRITARTPAQDIPLIKLRQAAQDAHSRLFYQENALQGYIGAAEVAVVGPRGTTGGSPTPLLAFPIGSALAASDTYADAVRALYTRHAVDSFVSVAGTQYAAEALPFTAHERAPGQEPVAQPWALVVRKPLAEVSDAVSAVRTAFLTAALAGLGLTVLLAIPLAGRIVRRLRRLRQAALRLAEVGPSVEVPSDRAHDEVGDLARAFAITQAQLRQQEEARRAFVATASHELRTPLASLEGMLELLDEDLQTGTPDLEDARALLQRARAQSHRLGRLAADLLDLSRIDAQVQLRSEPVELAELSRAVLAEFELGTGGRGVLTSLRDADGPVWALGDPGSVARILRILLDNALRVSPPGSRLTVELQRGGGVSLSVSDQGPGVKPDERELIFQRFQRGRGAGGQAGFGLGLAIGRELAERMGGRLTLDEGYRGGARFTLSLPAAGAPEREPLAVG